MKVLAISDVESKYLWDYFEPEKLAGVDLILSCGDLKASYLTLLATFTHAPLLYVHGNHDTDYERRPPEGCTCIEDTIYEVNGVRIAGLGGSVRYKPGPFQYTQREMERRVARLSARIRRMGGVDIIVSHAPIQGCNDGEDPAHMGFACFNALVERFQPQYFVHGHVHMNYGRIPRSAERGKTQVINAYERYTFELETPENSLVSPQRPFGSLLVPKLFWKTK